MNNNISYDPLNEYNYWNSTKDNSTSDKGKEPAIENINQSEYLSVYSKMPTSSTSRFNWKERIVQERKLARDALSGIIGVGTGIIMTRLAGGIIEVTAVAALGTIFTGVAFEKQALEVARTRKVEDTTATKAAIVAGAAVGAIVGVGGGVIRTATAGAIALGVSLAAKGMAINGDEVRRLMPQVEIGPVALGVVAIVVGTIAAEAMGPGAGAVVAAVGAASIGAAIEIHTLKRLRNVPSQKEIANSIETVVSETLQAATAAAVAAATVQLGITAHISVLIGAGTLAAVSIGLVRRRLKF